MTNLYELPKDRPYFSDYLLSLGLSHRQIQTATSSGLFKRTARGLYEFTGVSKSWVALVSALQEQKHFQTHLAGPSALEVYGVYQYLTNRHILLTPQRYKTTAIKDVLKEQKIWIIQTDFLSRTKKGLRKDKVQNHEVLVSSLERAFLECCFLCPLHVPPEELFQIAENIKTFDWDQMTTLLKEVHSIIVLRTAGFLFETLYNDVPKNLLASLKRRSGTNKRYVDEKNRGKEKFIASWKLMVPGEWFKVYKESHG